MKSPLNFKVGLPARKGLWLPIVLFLVIAAVFFTGRYALAPGIRIRTSQGKNAALQPGIKHTNITTTVFWIGETSSSDNGYIANDQSAWDENWQQNYGGVDSPDKRSGYLPAGFNPRENPFYAALPYNDITPDGRLKASGKACASYATSDSPNYSGCKNTWIAISYKGRTAYAQWEDVGPYEEDDYAYVFGSSRPKNTYGVGAGLDVSPAVRDYLGMPDVASTSWAFVRQEKLPNGPWTATTTASKGYLIEK